LDSQRSFYSGIEHPKSEVTLKRPVRGGSAKKVLLRNRTPENPRSHSEEARQVDTQQKDTPEAKKTADP